MSQTTRFGLHYQALTDAPDGSALGQALATDTDGWLARAYPVANAAGRVSLGAVPEGFLVRERDSDLVYIADEMGAWAQLGAGGTTTVTSGTSATFGQWSASSAVQSFVTGTETPVAFPDQDIASSVVTRSAKGVGHQFHVAAGLYLAACAVRFAAGAAGSRFIGLRTTDDAVQYATAQNDGGPAAATRTFCMPVLLAAAADLYVVASQDRKSVV